MSATDPIVEFVQDVVDAMGLDLTAAVEEETDGIRINLSGDDGSVLTRRQGEALAGVEGDLERARGAVQHEVGRPRSAHASVPITPARRRAQTRSSAGDHGRCGR